MSGISGAVTPRGGGARRLADQMARMQEKLRHRGPSKAEVWTGVGAALGYQCDGRGGGTGSSACGPSRAVSGCRLLLDGRIEIQQSLREGGAAPGLQGPEDDSLEAVVRLILNGGTSAAEQIQGAFAIALWQEAARRLTLLRDPLGLKPLYYVHAPDGSLFFASEPKALLAAGAVRPGLDYGTLPYYLANQTTPKGSTLFDGVRRLPPGHCLTWENGAVQVQEYARVAPRAPEALDDGESVERFSLLFRRAVSLGLTPGVRAGALLSPSVGSTAMAAVLAELSDQPLATFSVTAEDPDPAEAALVQRVARTFGVEHHQLLLPAREFFASLPAAVWHQDQPLAHPSRVVLYHAAALASDHVDTVWTAAGCDELLAGHPRYRQGLAATRLGRLWGALALTGRDGPARRKAHRFYLDALAVFGVAAQRGLLTEAAIERSAGAAPYDQLLQPLADGRARSLAGELLALDLEVWLPELTTTQDRVGMAVSLESQAPFLNRDLVEYAAGLPVRIKLRGRIPHYVLRRGLCRQLPSDTVPPPRRQRAGRVGEWLRGAFRPLLHEYVLSGRALDRGILRADAVGHLVAEHESGRADHTRQLWSLINLEIWQRLYLDGEAVAVKEPDLAAAVG
jgi:asparagine synthase (glutamine-hydrolysing)